MGENIHKIFDNGLILQLYKEHLQLNNNKKPDSKMDKGFNKYFFKEDIQMTSKHMKRY